MKGSPAEQQNEGAQELLKAIEACELELKEAAKKAIRAGPMTTNSLARSEMFLKLHDDAEYKDVLAHKIVFDASEFKKMVVEAMRMSVEEVNTIANSEEQASAGLKGLASFNSNRSIADNIVSLAVASMIAAAVKQRTTHDVAQSQYSREKGDRPPSGFVWKRTSDGEIVAATAPPKAIMNSNDPSGLVNKCVTLSVSNQIYDKAIGVVTRYDADLGRYEVTICGSKEVKAIKPDMLTELTAEQAILGQEGKQNKKPDKDKDSKGGGQTLSKTTDSSKEDKGKAQSSGEKLSKSGGEKGSEAQASKAKQPDPLGQPKPARDPEMVRRMQHCADKIKIAQEVLDNPKKIDIYNKPLLLSLLGKGAKGTMERIHKDSQERRRKKDGPLADIQEHFGVGKKPMDSTVKLDDQSCFMCGHNIMDTPHGTLHITKTVEGRRKVVGLEDMGAHTGCGEHKPCEFCEEWDDVIGSARYSHTRHMCPFDPDRFRELAQEILRLNRQPAERSRGRDPSPHKSANKRDRSRTRSRSRSRGRDSKRDRSRSRSRGRDRSRGQDNHSVISEESPAKKGSYGRR